ncbi:MAG: argininosuccinate lyase [Rikenellaceae bacterium]|jgi:argininosuccinate lyase|nr:argininosuccinate lyase [Rikenellaceae bacterium]
MKKLWSKTVDADQRVDAFTVGRDREMDVMLAEADVLGSLAHTRMLESIGLLTADELGQVQRELKKILATVRAGEFTIADGVEDVHSQVEFLLTERIGEVGKKIHSGRSRNDQVLVDLRIFLRHQIIEIVEASVQLFNRLQQLSEQHKDVLMPGYTHLQVAMPSSFGLWFGAYAESLVDDVQLMLAAWRVTNRNPLGSAAGYGSSFPLDRTMTTRLLGFDSPDYNVVYAQMGRGKTERIVAQGVSAIAATVGRLAMDNTLWLNQNFGFISYPDNLTTGSSIMPHKKNPDVWEIARGKCNLIAALPNQITMLTTNLPLGYNRDLQLLKEVLFPALTDMKEVLRMADYMLEHITVNRNILDDPRYAYLFSVESVNRLVLEGTPFRDAYKAVGLQIEAGAFHPAREVRHTHEGSIGNLCNAQIASLMTSVLAEFDFDRVRDAERHLAE